MTIIYIATIAWMWAIGFGITFAYGEANVFHSRPKTYDWLVVLFWPITIPSMFVFDITVRIVGRVRWR